jgi:hypothetical protein
MRSKWDGSYSEKMRSSRPPSMKGEHEPKRSVSWSSSSPRRKDNDDGSIIDG